MDEKGLKKAPYLILKYLDGKIVSKQKYIFTN